MRQLAQTEQFFFGKFGLSEEVLERTLGAFLGRRIDHADLYFEHRTTESVSLESGKVKGAAGMIVQGVGARVQAGEKTGYAYSDEISVKRIQLAAESAKYIATEAAKASLPAPVAGVLDVSRMLYPMIDHPIDVPLAERARLLQMVDDACRSFDPRVTEVMASVIVEDKKVMMVAHDGWSVGDSRPMLVLRVSVIAEDGSRRETAVSGGGGRMEFGKLFEGDFWKKIALDAARVAVLNLSAEDAPAGSMVVVLGPGWPGILLHEAIGHGLEGDFNRKKVSAFSDKLGKRVASDLCTVIDDGTIPGRRGSLNVDDEGTPTRRNVLIDKGILVGYMQDLQNARLMGMQPTGNGRRESYAHAPMPRMTNTFMLSGASTPEDIIASVPRGLYARNFGGGQVDITSGKFVFSASEAYMIENGAITRPVRGATLIGDGPTALTKISMVGNDSALDMGIGTCGKDGQSVPVGVGIPTVRIDEMTVGGTRVEGR